MDQHQQLMFLAKLGFADNVKALCSERSVPEEESNRWIGMAGAWIVLNRLKQEDAGDMEMFEYFKHPLISAYLASPDPDYLIGLVRELGRHTDCGSERYGDTGPFMALEYENLSRALLALSGTDEAFKKELGGLITVLYGIIFHPQVLEIDESHSNYLKLLEPFSQLVAEPQDVVRSAIDTWRDWSDSAYGIVDSFKEVHPYYTEMLKVMISLTGEPFVSGVFFDYFHEEKKVYDFFVTSAGLKKQEGGQKAQAEEKRQLELSRRVLSALGHYDPTIGRSELIKSVSTTTVPDAVKTIFDWMESPNHPRKRFAVLNLLKETPNTAESALVAAVRQAVTESFNDSVTKTNYDELYKFVGIDEKYLDNSNPAIRLFIESTSAEKSS